MRQVTERLSTGDKVELERFNALANTWWDPAGPMWPLHSMNRFRIQVILDVLAKQGILPTDQDRPLTGLKVLDIGCGGGILSEALAQLGAQVTGIDLAERNIRIAQEHARANGLDIDYRFMDISALDEEFDLVFNMEVVEHVSNLPLFLAACSRRLKPGGVTFVSTLNRTPLSFLLAIIGAEYVLRLLPRGTHQWPKFVKPVELTSLLKQNGTDVFWYSGIRFNPFTRRFRLQRSMAVNYLLAARKLPWQGITIPVPGGIADDGKHYDQA